MDFITTVEQLLEARPDICEPEREWLADNGITTLAEAWDRCNRGDWMLWLDGALDLLTDRERRMIACRCVRETPLADGRNVWDLLTDERSRHAVEVAERYAVGDATDEQLAVAWTAAEAAARDAAEALDAAEAAARAARTAAHAAAAVRDTPWNGAAAAAAAARTAADAASRAATEARATANAAAAAAAAAAKMVDAAYAAVSAATAAADEAGQAYAARAYALGVAYAAQADIVREIVGNPWRKEA